MYLLLLLLQLELLLLLLLLEQALQLLLVVQLLLLLLLVLLILLLACLMLRLLRLRAGGLRAGVPALLAAAPCGAKWSGVTVSDLTLRLRPMRCHHRLCRQTTWRFQHANMVNCSQ